MSADDTFLVIRTLNPKRHNGGPTYLYRVVWTQAAENFDSIEVVRERTANTRVTANRGQALVLAHNMNKKHRSGYGAEYGVVEISFNVEY